MKLVDIYTLPDREEAYRILLEVLSERTPDQNISHKKMPSLEQHRAFVDSQPYMAWYLIEAPSEGIVGSVYLSKAREVGLFIFRRHQGKGFGAKAFALLRQKHPGRLLANINPANENSIRFFESLGFSHIQNTYELV
jgi:RimJ/RimL family protein N-acetyltransferase